MKPIYQTRFGDEDGNCFQAMLASVLEVPLESVPNFMTGQTEANAWKVPLNAWLRQFGLGYVETEAKGYIPKGCIHELAGQSQRGCLHSTVADQGDMIHDPHPEGGGVEVTFYGFFVALNPAAWNTRPNATAEADGTAGRDLAWAREDTDRRLSQAADALEAAQRNVCRAHGFPPHVERMIEAALVALRACARERP